MNGNLEKKAGKRWIVSRRDFLKASGIAVASGLWLPSTEALGQAAAAKVTLRFGLVTDIHYADIPKGGGGGTRYYRESLGKLGECVDLMNEQKVGFLCELGDFKDQDVPPKEETTLEYLRTVHAAFGKFEGPKHHVLGNHDLDSLSKAQFMSVTGMPSSYYAFDEGGVHFVVLDACYDSADMDYDHGKFSWADANVSTDELGWLAEDLAQAEGPVVGFVHQRIDAGTNSSFVRNAAEVRKVLEASGKVFAVFQGHFHPGGYQQINGIHYYTLKGLVEGSGPENNTYAIVDVLSEGGMVVTGYRKAQSKDLPA